MSNNPGSRLSAMAVTVTPQPPQGRFGQLSGGRTGGEGVGENSPPPYGLPRRLPTGPLPQRVTEVGGQ
ncbi:hypothetical protein FHU38_000238 [Saccharomonospora amisosensis]|uniref:Uncharacterized protein n=1 Tax=Saccharomonospora amisosensis TaxID=1128677 RepID=A0A7X5ZNQ9_9PSEU|nr:hypothetical protein [Saccharomonospora amisosensis]